jgi:hypothetical protein
VRTASIEVDKTYCKYRHTLLKKKVKILNLGN